MYTRVIEKSFEKDSWYVTTGRAKPLTERKVLHWQRHKAYRLCKSFWLYKQNHVWNFMERRCHLLRLIKGPCKQRKIVINTGKCQTKDVQINKEVRSKRAAFIYSD